jgi:hypothetical protein
MKRFLGACLIWAILILGLFSVHVLEIRAERENRTVFIRTVQPGFHFKLGFTHSVEQCPVMDYLKVDEKYRMVLYKTAFWSSRTGLPYAAFGDEVFRAEGDHFTISNMHRVIPGLHQWVEKKYHNSLTFGEAQSIDLATLAGDTLLCIDVKRMKLWMYVAKKLAVNLI